MTSRPSQAGAPADRRKLTLCWVQHGGEGGWLIQLARALDDLGCELRIVATLRQYHEWYREAGLASELISGIVDSPAEHRPEVAQEYEDRYGPPGIQWIAALDQHLGELFGPDSPRSRAVVLAAYRFWESYLDRHDPDVLVFRDIGSFATRTAFEVARARGRPAHLIFHLGPTDGRTILADVDESSIWSELVEKVGRPADGSPPERRKDELREEVRGRVDLSGPSMAPSQLMSHSAIQLTRIMLQETMRERAARRKGEAIAVVAARLTRRKYWNVFRWRFVSSRLFRYDLPREGDAYVYLPLFFEKEWQNLVGAHFISTNLTAVVREVSLSLPHGHLLYVKEHPAVPGEFSLARLRELRAIPNVRVIDPRASGRHLVAKSAATVSILSGTSGWEAFLLRRPVVSIGDSWYGLSDLVQSCSRLEALPEALWEALKGGEAEYAAREDDWLRFIDAVIGSCVQANIYNHRPPFFSAHNEENSRRMAQALADKAAQLVERRSEPAGR